MSLRRSLATTLAGASLILAALSSPGAAHTLPVHSHPPAGAVLAEAPREVWVRFDGHLELALSRLRVEDSDGKRVDLGPEEAKRSQAKALRVALPPLPAGTYRVRWKAVGTDGHGTVGDYSFRVR